MRKSKNKLVLITTILFFVIFTSLTIGYAFSDKILDLNGTVTVLRQGKFEIVSIEKKSGNLPSNNGQGLYLDSDGNIALDLHFSFSKQSENNYDATYLITMHNDTYTDFVFTGFNIATQVNIVGASSSDAGATVSYEYVNSYGSDVDLTTNNIIYAGETRKLAVKLSIYAGASKGGINVNVTGEGDINTSEDNSGQFYGYLDTNTQNVDLKNKNIDCFNFSVLNTFKNAKTFTIRPGNSSFDFVNSDGTPLQSFTIAAPNEDNPESNVQSYTACMVAKSTSVFLNENSSSSVLISSDGLSPYSIGTLNIAVPKYEAKDEEKIHIGNVSFETVKYDTTNSSLITKVSWSHLPDQSNVSTSVINYYIQLYDNNSSTTTPIKTFTVPGDASIENYQLVLDSTVLNEKNMITNNHKYFVKVYGVDEAGNTGINDCSSSGNDYCVSSGTPISLKYRFNITLESTNDRASFVNNSKYVYLNASFEDQIKTNSTDYNMDGSITITMGNNALSSDKYFYGLNSGSTTQSTLRINEGVINNNITAEVTVTNSSGWCLVEGTKIRLANGTTKNIEDIEYDDLILAFNHNTGKISYEYPIWIEEKGEVNEYQIATFSDGTTLKTVGSHGIYSPDYNEYISVLDREKFKAGTRVVKINDNNEKEIVTVKNIETKFETVNYYHVSSTYYHNVIANDLITTDAILVVSNMFKFNPDLTWTNEREEFIKKGDLFVYEDWAHVFPEHIFKGFRMSEAMILQQKGLLDISLFDIILNGRMKNPPMTEKGLYKWPMTTSDGYSKFYEQDSYFTLPMPIIKENKMFVGWYNHADNKIYKPNDKVKVIYGMYFEAIWIDKY